jgi:hypothetical protein
MRVALLLLLAAAPAFADDLVYSVVVWETPNYHQGMAVTLGPVSAAKCESFKAQLASGRTPLPVPPNMQMLVNDCLRKEQLMTNLNSYGCHAVPGAGKDLPKNPGAQLWDYTCLR